MVSLPDENDRNANQSSSTICNEDKKTNEHSFKIPHLPIFRVKLDLLEKLKNFDSLIILGETGCGKTTQIPKFILEHGINKQSPIIVSQPRRIAAVSIARRVAEELNEICGEGTVGYRIRFQNETGSRTSLIYATDGTLLREAIDDNLLLKYSVIILDEAHERTVTTDILLGIVQSAQQIRKSRNETPLKVIIMSAALDADHFRSYFNDAPVFIIEGRHHEVGIYHAQERIDDYYFTCLVTAFNINAEAPANHDILIFLTGQEEIEKMARDIKTIAKSPEYTGPPLRVHTLYAAADPKCQLDVFESSPKGTRKIVISTNIAETSLTIPGIKYVIDSGKVKMKYHNPVTGVNILKVSTISQEQAIQRAGRAGRESDGFCYRAYSIEQFEEMRKSTVPEIHRCNLSSVSLTLLAMDKDPRKFNFIDRPEEFAIKNSLEELFDLGALSQVDANTLTSIDTKMSLLPLDPKFSKIIFSAVEFNCVDEILDIIAMLSTDNIFITPASSQIEVRDIKQKFHSSVGDHLTLLNVYRKFNSIKQKPEWCRDNYLSYRALDFAKYIKMQLVTLCNKLHIRSTSCGQETDNIRKCLISGLFKNVAVLQKDKSYSTVVSRQRVRIHPSSVLHKSLPYCVIYTELVESNELYMKTISTIDPDWIEQIVPDNLKTKYSYVLPS